MTTSKLTDGPKHHFFGFHDLAITSTGHGRWLGLAVDRIDRPPMGEDYAEVTVWDEAGAQPRVLTLTRNFNFPQGARQQWLGQSEIVIVNAEGANGQPIATLHDAADGRAIGQVSESTYCTNGSGTRSYTVDFGRLHRLGGYGHSHVWDRTPESSSPPDNGIFVTEIEADRTELLLSIDTVRTAAGIEATTTGAHYLTHLRMNPSSRRLAFLHRFRLSDGGEETCLWAADPDGGNLRLLIRGFLSHFDWIDDGRLIIWGRRNQAIAAMRRSPLLSNPLARVVLPLIKGPLRAVLGRSKSMAQSYLKLSDSAEPAPVPFAQGVMTRDGHPMLNPMNGGSLVTDTYPDERGNRDLMLYHLEAGLREDLGSFRKLDEVPSNAVLNQVAAHLKDTVDVRIAPELYAFTRSGLHCDLHPRWTADGRCVAFDSIHEGSRQIYTMDVSSRLKTG